MTDAPIPEAVDSCFRRNDRKKFEHRVIKEALEEKRRGKLREL
ncbi:Uncharacterized protein dnm_097920 [Desulfonema magnum]|uniref:Uncharacterized protein n=1 Tax=Desulfonema magnum TaxID=45655 RepID=A0A975GVY9_9BACT|nr:Uncharacterized protein dnm_097920 [Desulfonema magnum]